jgi:hypothetical protein
MQVDPEFRDFIGEISRELSILEKRTISARELTKRMGERKDKLKEILRMRMDEILNFDRRLK